MSYSLLVSDIDTIIGKVTFTMDPTMKNGKTLTLENGMRVKMTPIQLTDLHKQCPEILHLRQQLQALLSTEYF